MKDTQWEIAKENGQFIVFNSYGKICWVANYSSQKETEANARLIASARELLEALKLAQTVIDALTTPPVNKCEYTKNILKQAIEKAES